MSETITRPGTKLVYAGRVEDRIVLLGDGRAIVCNPQHPPKLVYPDGHEEELPMLSAAAQP